MIRVIGVILAAALFLGGSVLLALRFYDAPGPLSDVRAAVVPRGGIDQIADLLAKAGIVGNPTALRLAALMTRAQGPLRSGELAFPPHSSLRTVLLVLRFGKPVQHRLTIPEGLTAAQVATLVSTAPAAEGETPVPEEGSILPETYAYELGATRVSLLDRAHKAMERALDQAWAARSPASAPLTEPGQALILASIVERETRIADERPRVAMVFLNRLRRGMKLQSDPTVVYGDSGGFGVQDHAITRSELDRNNPYNTYKIAGLPPGPISMPGVATLKAVTQPWPSEELFFVADGTGGHMFAKTEAEHQRNVARWREFERQRAAAAVAGKPVQN